MAAAAVSEVMWLGPPPAETWAGRCQDASLHQPPGSRCKLQRGSSLVAQLLLLKARMSPATAPCQTAADQLPQQHERTQQAAPQDRTSPPPRHDGSSSSCSPDSSTPAVKPPGMQPSDSPFAAAAADRRWQAAATSARKSVRRWCRRVAAQLREAGASLPGAKKAFPRLRSNSSCGDAPRRLQSSQQQQRRRRAKLQQSSFAATGSENIRVLLGPWVLCGSITRFKMLLLSEQLHECYLRAVLTQPPAPGQQADRQQQLHYWQQEWAGMDEQPAWEDDFSVVLDNRYAAATRAALFWWAGALRPLRQQAAAEEAVEAEAQAAARHRQEQQQQQQLAAASCSSAAREEECHGQPSSPAGACVRVVAPAMLQCVA